MAKKISGIQLARRITLGIMLAGMTILSVMHQKMQGIPSIDALDPFGGLETLLNFIAGGELIKKIEPGNIVLFGGFVVLSIVLSRFFCGWFCAFGALQAVFGSIGKKLFGRRFIVPVKLDRVLRLLKYPMLVGIVWITWQTGTLFIRPYEPFAAYGHLSAGFAELLGEFLVGFIALIAVMSLSMLYDRVFCKYLCPLGAVNAILGRIPLFRIKRSADSCISCSKCDKVCPMNIDVSKAGVINSPECISCMECVTACPTKPNSLETTIAGKKVTLTAVVVIGFAIFLGAGIVGQLSGMLHFAAPALTSMAAEGNLTIADIKGSTSYQMISDSFGIELEKLYREAGVDMKVVPPESMIKETGTLAGIEGFEADEVRLAVSRITGIPYAGEDGDKAAEGAAIIVSPVTPVAAASSLAAPADFALEGTMTIVEVAAALNATTAAVIDKLGLPADIPLDKPLRDMKDTYGYTMPDLKEKILK